MKQLLAMVFALVSSLALAGPASTTVTFSNGYEGWVPPTGTAGASFISSTPGNKYGPALYTIHPDTSGLEWSNRTNPAFIGNFGRMKSVTIGLDINVKSITFRGREVERELVVELRDYDNPYNGMPYTAVWAKLGTISKKGTWQHMQVSIPDTWATTMPAGWGGTGSGGLSLPPGRTFTDVLASVDEIAITTYVPGWFYGFTAYDLAVDNLSVTVSGSR
ncbi:MAG: PEP-CTERM sorting domain-containing protein [Alphaproteobacteria bacterium]|nr:MAG: PEP-CTERM sorting domain-containing protein [Alphaproteobacteria bacterium]